MATLKERLQQAPDSFTTSVKIDGIGEITIKRLTLRERDEMLKHRPANADDVMQGSVAMRHLVRLALVEPTATDEELLDLPAVTVEAIAKTVMDFNGWTPQGRGSLEDQFRPAAGPSV